MAHPRMLISSIYEDLKDIVIYPKSFFIVFTVAVFRVDYNQITGELQNDKK